jgi:hypothetical protein
MSSADASSIARDAGAAGDAASEADVGGAATYSGVVVASQYTSDMGSTYSAFTMFSTGSAFALGGCTGGADVAACCACESGIPTPDPFRVIPDAGTVRLATADGMTIATMAPTYSTVDDAGSVSSSLYGTWDLGLWGFGPVSDYAEAMTLPPWNPGDALTVTASGDQVHAFSGTLLTGGRLQGVTPAMDGATVTIDRATPLVVSWTPEGEDEDVGLLLQQTTPDSYVNCFCAVPDSAGSVSVDTSVLAGFVTTEDAGLQAQLAGSIALERLRTTRITSDNATIALVGEVQTSGKVMFR